MPFPVAATRGKNYGAGGAGAQPPSGLTAPSGLSATANGGYQRINLAWTDNSDSELGFKIYRSTNGVDFSLLDTIGENIEAYEDSGLTPGQIYYYYVTAYDAGDESDPSNTDDATVFDPDSLSWTVVLDANVGTYESNGGAPSSDGNDVGYWEDQSGNNNHASQTTAANKPHLQTNIQNGLSIVRGDGSNDKMATPSISLTNFTIFVGCIIRNVADTRILYQYDGADGWFVAPWTYGYYNIAPAAQSGWNVTEDLALIATGVRGSGAIKSRQNGTEVGSAALTVPTTSAVIHILSDLVPAKWGQIDLGEIRIANSELSGANIQLMEEYFSDRWGVPLDGGTYHKPLTTPTYDGSGQAIHPSVYDAGLGITWNGHRYWMAMTPYPNENDANENPSILVSEDGETWAVPDGLINPIDARPSGSTHNFDTEILHAQDDKLYVYYGDNLVANYNMNVRSSPDGVNWSSETTLFSGSGALSPTVDWDGSQYVMWYIKESDRSLRRRTCATPDGAWSDESAALTINSIPASTQPWHIFIRKISDGSYLGLFHFPGTGSQLGGNMWWVTSSDGLTWTVQTAAIEHLDYSAATSSIYRACFVENDTDDYTIWFGTRTTGGTWRMGWKQDPLPY